MTYISTAIFGLLSLGWANLVYRYLFEFLYFSFEVKPKVEYCREFIHGSFCNIVAYLSLWVMELPLAIFSFITFSFFLVLIKKYFSKAKINVFYIIGTYIIAYFVFILLGPYGKGNIWFYFFTTLFHGAIFLVSAWAVYHLTNRTITPPQASAGRS